MALRHKKKIIKDQGDGSGNDGGLTIHYVNRNQLADAFQKSAFLSQPESILASQNKEQKELIATLQKSLEDKTKELKISQASSQEVNNHRALLVAQHTRLEKEKHALELDITALEDSHKSEVEALQQEAKAAEKKATDKVKALQEKCISTEHGLAKQLEDSRASYTQMKQGLEQQIYELQQQNENLRESTWCDIKVANESITSLQQSNQKLQLSNNNLRQSINQYSRAYGTLQQSSKKLQRSFQEQAVEMKAKADAHEQLSLEHKKLQETLQTATEVIEPLKSRIHALEQQYKEQQESSTAKYNELETQYKLLENDNKVKSDEIQAKTNALAESNEKVSREIEKIHTLKQQYEEYQESSTAKYNTLQKEYKLLENDNKAKSDEVQTLKTEARDVKKKIETEMKVLQEKHQSICQHYETERTTLNDSIASLRNEKQTKELKINEIVSAKNGLSNLYDAKKKENETLQSNIKSLELNIEEMKSNEKDLVRLHKSEIETSSQQYEEQVTELRDSVVTIQQEKQDLELVLFSHEKEIKNQKEENETLQSNIKSLELSMKEIKTSKEKLIHFHNSEKASLLQKNETQLSTLNDSIDTHLREKKANELEIKELKSSNAELSTLNDEQGKDNEVLESTVTSLEQSVKALKTKEEELIRSHKEEVAIQNETAERMKAQVKDLTEENQSQVKINSSLQSQLDGASDCKNAMQERINLLEMKLQKATSSSSNNDSSKTTSGDDIAKVKSSEGDEGSVDVKTKASKPEPTTATLDKVLQDKKEGQKTSAQANSTPRSSLSNALSDIGNRQSVNSTNSATTKQKKATDIKSQAPTTNRSKKASVVQQQLPPDENSTVTCPATSELCSDHFTKERNEVQNEARSSVSSTSSSEGSPGSILVPWNKDDSSFCSSGNANQGRGRVARRKKRESFKDYKNRKDSLEKNNIHQVSEAKAKEVGTKPQAYEQDKANGVAVDEEAKKTPEPDSRNSNEQDKTVDGIDVGKEAKEEKKTPKTEKLSPISQQGSNRRKRKATVSSNEKTQPNRKRSTVDNKANVANSGDVKDKEIVDSAGIKCGEVGYKFKKWFSGSAEWKEGWYEGEVKELVNVRSKKKQKKLVRRCEYADGGVEDYTISEMKKLCFEPR